MYQLRDAHKNCGDSILQVYLDKSVSISCIFDKSEEFSGKGTILVVLYPISRNPGFDISDIFRWQSELTQTRSAANALHTAHSRRCQAVLPF